MSPKEKLMKKIKIIKKELINQFVDDVEVIFEKTKNAVLGKHGMFYSSYPAKKYIRQYELSEIPELKTNRKIGNYNVSFKYENLSGHYRVVDKLGSDGYKYIYETAFLLGWHGGASGGPKDKAGRKFPGRRYSIASDEHDIEDSNFGDLYWRKPTPHYSYWGKGAVLTRSPYKLFVNMFENLVQEETDKISDLFFEKALPLFVEYKREIEEGGD